MLRIDGPSPTTTYASVERPGNLGLQEPCYGNKIAADKAYLYCLIDRSLSLMNAFKSELQECDSDEIQLELLHDKSETYYSQLERTLSQIVLRAVQTLGADVENLVIRTLSFPIFPSFLIVENVVLPDLKRLGGNHVSDVLTRPYELDLNIVEAKAHHWQNVVG